MNKIIAAAVGVVFFSGVLFSSAKAAEKGSTYIRLQPTHVIFDAIGFSQSLSGYGVTVTAAGEWAFDAGYGISGAFGRKLSKNVSIETEIGYSSVDYNAVNITATFTSGGSTFTSVGQADVKGQIKMLTTLVNLIFSAPGPNFSPYVGGGIGFANFWDEINSIGTLTVNGEESGFTILANGILGFDYKMADDMALGLQYRYVWAASGHDGVDDATAHVIALSAKINF